MAASIISGGAKPESEPASGPSRGIAFNAQSSSTLSCRGTTQPSLSV